MLVLSWLKLTVYNAFMFIHVVVVEIEMLTYFFSGTTIPLRFVIISGKGKMFYIISKAAQLEKQEIKKLNKLY